MASSRRDFLAASAATAAATLAAQAPPPKRPNVLLILTDDQGHGDFSTHDNPMVKTPNWDALAKQSVRFTRFTVSPVCAPTRASLLTGRYHLRTGVWGVTAGRETMNTSEVTLGEAFQSAGYRTALIGKWHLGEHYPNVPHAQGFDEFVGFRLGHWNRYFDPPLERNGQPFRAKGYIADVLTDQAISYLNERRGADPFFLYLAYNTPHSPYIVPDEAWDRFEGKIEDPELRSIYAMVENLDANVGRLLRHLDKSGLANDTIVLFLCDNGPQTDRFNNGLRGRKASVYEGGTRSPLWIRWPGQLAPHAVDRIAAHIDLYPTLLDLCRIQAPAGPPIDGRSLAPLLRSKDAAATWPDRAIFTHQAGNRFAAPFPGAVRTQRWSLVNGKELYDLEADPGQRHEVSAQHPEIAQDLRAQYDAWFASAVQGCNFSSPRIPVGYAEENPVWLPATRATFTGGVKFAAGNGYAHDSLTGWTAADDSIAWDIDAVQAGRYEVFVEYLLPLEAVTEITINGVTAKFDRPTPMDILNTGQRVVRHTYFERAWRRQRAVALELAKGESRIELKGASRTGDRYLDLRGIHLRRLT